MEDMERYGDYNEVDEAPGGGKNPVVMVLKGLVIAVCLLVVGVILFRIFLFNSYPDEIKKLIFTPALEVYYAAEDGDIKLYTQSTEVRYDDPQEGNFFFDCLVIAPEADHLQVAIRYNTSLMDSIKSKYGIAIDPNADPTEIFEFTLVKTRPGYVQTEDDEVVPVESVGRLVGTATADSLMYRYCKLAFDGVDFGLDEGESAVAWFRLDITIKGVEMKEPYSLPVYQSALKLEERELASNEVPQ